MDMTPQRWENTCAYLQEVFGRQDTDLAELRNRAIARGLPDIAISPDVGRLLMILTALTGRDGRGATLALELGTLAGYSAIWIARGLAPDGRLVTVEIDDHHADAAQSEFQRAGVADRIEIVRSAALDALPVLAERFGPESFDLIFLDAVKAEYPAYLEAARPLLRPGGLLLADNALGSSEWWIDDEVGVDPEADRSRVAMDRFNRELASDAGFEAVCVPIRQGLTIGRKILLS